MNDLDNPVALFEEEAAITKVCGRITHWLMRRWLLQLQLVEQTQPKSVWVATTGSSIRRWAIPNDNDMLTLSDEPLVSNPEQVIQGQFSIFCSGCLF